MLLLLLLMLRVGSEQEVVCQGAIVEAQLPHVRLGEALQRERPVQARHRVLQDEECKITRDF